MKVRNLQLSIRWYQDTVFGYTGCESTNCIFLDDPNFEKDIPENRETVLKNIRKAFRLFKSTKYNGLSVEIWCEDEYKIWQKSMRVYQDYGNVRNGTVKKIEYHGDEKNTNDCTKEIALKALTNAIDLAIANRTMKEVV